MKKIQGFNGGVQKEEKEEIKETKIPEIIKGVTAPPPPPENLPVESKIEPPEKVEPPPAPPPPQKYPNGDPYREPIA